MQNKVGPAAIAIAAIVIIIFCVGLYKHFNPTTGSGSNEVYKPSYATSHNASPSANATPRSKG